MTRERPRPAGMPAQAGFSLLEMMVVILILIIISAISIPTLIRAIRGYQTESAARQVSNMIMTARYEAMRRNRRVCTLYQRIGNENRFGLDINGPDKDPCDDGAPQLDGADPFTVNDVTIDWWNGGTPALPPDFAGLPAGYDSAAEASAPARYRITFSPRGTVMVRVGGVWNLATTVQMIVLRRMVGGSDVDRILITVTPMGRILLYRWDYAGNRWNTM